MSMIKYIEIYAKGITYTAVGLLILCATLVHLGFGVVEAIILSKNNAKGECGPEIWGCIVMCCVVHLGLFIVRCCGRAKKESDDKEGTFLWQLGSLACIVWVMICYYNTRSDCVDHYKKMYPHLWNILFAEVILFYIGLGITVIITIIYIIVNCCGNRNASNQHASNQQTTSPQTLQHASNQHATNQHASNQHATNNPVCPNLRIDIQNKTDVEYDSNLLTKPMTYNPKHIKHIISNNTLVEHPVQHKYNMFEVTINDLIDKKTQC